MVIQITNKCNENCSHCFVDATPDGNKMSKDTLIETIKFLKKAQPIVVQITGGEPTTHPNFFEFVNAFVKNLPKITFTILSNGSFFFNDELRAKVLKVLSYPTVLALQIRTDKKYYPNYDKIIQNKDKIENLHEKIDVYDGVDGIIKLGRGKNITKDIATQSPMCANLVMLNKQKDFKSFPEYIKYYQMNTKKFCAPSINEDGYLHAGETPNCKTLGHVSDNIDYLMDKIKKHEMCGNCKLTLNTNNIKFMPEC